MTSVELSSEAISGVDCIRGSEDSDIQVSPNIEHNLEGKTFEEPSKNRYHPKLSLDSLPEEIIYLIFSFISARELFTSLKLVCKHFNQMLSEHYFKRRLLKFLALKETPRALKAVGLEHGENPLRWEFACSSYECEYDIWSHKNFHRIYRRDFGNNTSSVDVAKILGDGNLLMSAGRDRVLNLWNVEKDPRLLNFNDTAHSGWIWDIVPGEDHSAYSCDWDGKIIKWSLENEISEPIQIYQIGRPVLNLCIQNNMLVAGLQTGEICIIDPRSTSEAINQRVHRSAVMGVEILDSTILSISEDRSLSVFDVRANKKLKKLRITGQGIPVSMAILNSGLYVAQTNGTISLINTSTFKIWEVYHTNSSRLTSINASKLGFLITASRNAQVSLYIPGKDLERIRTIEIGAEVARVDYSKGILVISRSDKKVTIFNSNILD